MGAIQYSSAKEFEAGLGSITAAALARSSNWPHLWHKTG